MCIFLSGEKLIPGYQVLLQQVKPCTALNMAQQCTMITARSSAPSGIQSQGDALRVTQGSGGTTGHGWRCRQWKSESQDSGPAARLGGCLAPHGSFQGTGCLEIEVD